MNRQELHTENRRIQHLTYEQGAGIRTYLVDDGEIDIVTFQAREPFEVDGIQYQHPSFVPDTMSYIGLLFEFKHGL